MEREVSMGDVDRMSHSDRILRLDRKQFGPDAVKCPINPEHGAMGVHSSGSMLMCTFITQRQPSLRMCNGHVALSGSE